MHYKASFLILCFSLQIVYIYFVLLLQENVKKELDAKWDEHEVCSSGLNLFFLSKGSSICCLKFWQHCGGQAKKGNTATSMRVKAPKGFVLKWHFWHSLPKSRWPWFHSSSCYTRCKKALEYHCIGPARRWYCKLKKFIDAIHNIHVDIGNPWNSDRLVTVMSWGFSHGFSVPDRFLSAMIFDFDQNLVHCHPDYVVPWQDVVRKFVCLCVVNLYQYLGPKTCMPYQQNGFTTQVQLSAYESWDILFMLHFEMQYPWPLPLMLCSEQKMQIAVQVWMMRILCTFRFALTIQRIV